MVDAPLFCLIAGEASGDVLGAALMRGLRQKTNGNVRFMGIGGHRMRAEGMECLFPQEELAHMGVVELLRHIPRILRRIRETVAAIKAAQPAALITIDAPDFSFRVAKKLVGAGIPLIHYVAPTVWAWRPKRAKKIAQFLDHLLVLLPFEPPYFTREGLGCTFVGHSIVEGGAARGDAARLRTKYAVPDDGMLLTVLPGSRMGESTRLLPIFAATAKKLVAQFPHLRVVIPTVPHLKDMLSEVTKTWGVPVLITEGDTDKYDAFAASRAALACSGTVAVELALARLPAVIAYRANALTAYVARRLIRIKYANLVNLMHDKMVVPECLQENCTSENLAAKLADLLGNDAVRQQQITDLGDVASWLGQGQFIPSERAAETVLDIVAHHKKGTQS